MNWIHFIKLEPVQRSENGCNMRNLGALTTVSARSCEFVELRKIVLQRVTVVKVLCLVNRSSDGNDCDGVDDAAVVQVGCLRLLNTVSSSEGLVTVSCLTDETFTEGSGISTP